MASMLHKDPQGESFYQQAVPYLLQANSKFEAVTADKPTASALEVNDFQGRKTLEDPTESKLRHGAVELAAALRTSVDHTQC